MLFQMNEILETVAMVETEHLDIRTVTLGVSLRDCADPDAKACARKVREKLLRAGSRLYDVVADVEAKYGIPIVNRRISVTPVAMILDASHGQDPRPVAEALDRAAEELRIDFIGGYSALVEKGITKGDAALLDSLPEVLASTKRLCGSVNVATTAAGINLDAVNQVARLVKRTAELTKERDSIGCAKFVVFANAVHDNPFMAGAFHGPGEGEFAINVGVSGPGVVNRIVSGMADARFDEVSDAIKRTAFKITRLGEMVGREVAGKLGLPFGIVDLSLAPTPAEGDSIAEILEGMGVPVAGAFGSVACLAMLNDAVKKGGAMATSHVGGLSGAFIPVSEDQGMIRAAQSGALTLEMLLAMTSVCSVGLDMVAIPGDVRDSTLAAIIADECAIGVVNHKTTACRLIPAFGKKAGDSVNYGGLLGEAPVMAVRDYESRLFMRRGGRSPAPVTSIRN